MFFSFDSFVLKLKKYSQNKIKEVVCGTWYGNTILVIILTIIIYYMGCMIFRLNHILSIVFYIFLLFIIVIYISSRKIGFGLGDKGFCYGKSKILKGDFYKFSDIPFERIKYIDVKNFFSFTFVKMSFISDDLKLEKILFCFNTYVFGFNLNEHKKNAIIIRKKLEDIQKIVDKGDY